MNIYQNWNWIRNIDTNQWTPNSDSLNKSDFDALVQDTEKVAYYQKCLSGSTYVAVQSPVVGSNSSVRINDVYEVLSHYTASSYYFDSIGLTYCQPFSGILPEDPIAISSTSSLYNYLDKIVPDYNLTLKNLFTPKRLIDDQDNVFYVDVASTTPFTNLNVPMVGLVIDGVRVLVGHRVLVKDQYDLVTIPVSTDPNSLFLGHYELVSVIGTDATYKVPSSLNGIYEFTSSHNLIRTADLDIYADIMRYSICVKLGVSNREVQYKLQRLSSGLYPEYFIGDPMYFIPTHNFVLRNIVEYDNLYELSLNDTFKHDSQIISVNITGSYSATLTYSIPERTLAIGEFGVILNTQEGVTNIIDSKYKDTLNGICETSRYYWICADSGTFIRVDKIDFSIKKIDLIFTSLTPNQSSSSVVITKLNSVHFINDLRGVVVGDYNQIWETNDGGNTWIQIYITIFDGYSYNKVIFPFTNTFYVGGDNGVFIQFDYNLGNWMPHKKRVAKYVDGLSDEYLLISNIVDMEYFDGYISIVSESNDIYVYDINNSFSNWSFLYLIDSTYGSNNFTNLTSVTWVGTTHSLFFSTFAGIYEVDPFNSYFVGTNSNVIAATVSQISTQSATNALYDYNDIELITAGNYSTWTYATYSISMSFSTVYDPTFFPRLKPRMLFLDYDIGSKLYWFDGYNQYRLPSRFEVPVSWLQGAGTYSHIGFNQNTNLYYDANTSTTYSYHETNWITYWKDRLKTFEYYSNLDEPHVVEPSFTFSCSSVGNTFSYATVSVSTSYSDIVNLMPSAIPPMQMASPTQSSRFRSVFGVSISIPATSFDLYFYDYLGVWRCPVDTEVGDVLNITSDIFNGNFIVNKIYTSGPNKFAYFYTDFNQNILNSINNTTGITIRNLNKYPLGLNLANTQYFIDNFNQHYIGLSYICDMNTDVYPSVGLTQSFRVTGKYSQWSAYYNLQATVDVLSVTNSLYSEEILYPSGFLDFGYSPTYNLLSYLNWIDPSEYIPSKEFLAMPNYIAIPGPQLNPGDTDNQIYIDITYETNKLNFGVNLKYIYDSFMSWTFVDVDLHFQISYPGTQSFTTERLLIIDKYYDSVNNWYTIEFHDAIQSNNISATYYPNIYYIDVLSRRTLQQISDDLQYANNIHRPEWLIQDSYSIPPGPVVSGTYSNYETELKFKVPTDSYTKILVSDSSIVRNLTSIIYTDYKNELAMQITKLNREYTYEVTSVSVNSGLYQLDFSQKHGLKNNDYIIISLIGTQSQYPLSILGYHNIQYVNDYSILLPITSVGIFPADFSVYFVKEDYFLEYEPIDLFDMGVGDKTVTQAVSISTENYTINGFQYDLVGLDLGVYNYRLIDGLDLISINTKFPWILQAEISNAVIGLDSNNNLVWYEGIWWCGRWFGGTWVSGSWISGDWYSGTWLSTIVTNNALSVSIDTQNTNNFSSLWYSGRWYSGNWNNGTWYGGSWYGGTWSNGIWYGGTWNDGNWNNGIFEAGIWVQGQWNEGLFNTDNGPSFWIDGKFYGGDFENGVWYNGILDQKNNNTTRFGTRSTNSSNSIWKSGKFISGQFHSSLNVDSNGHPIVSDIHKYSKWYTGLFAGGDYYGGIVYSVDFKNAIWHGGILQDIEVLSIYSPTSSHQATASYIQLSGEYNFNVGDQFYLVDNQDTGTFSVYGSINTPMLYTNLNAVYDVNTNTTYVNTEQYLGYISNVSGTVSNTMRCVSYFDNSIWNSGIWFNGVFKNGTFNGGIWYEGYFSGIWG